MHTAAVAIATRAGEEGRPLSWAPSAAAVAGEGGMILDLHIHTSWHSADSNLSPIDLIREAKRLGLDGVVVTEHDRGWTASGRATSLPSTIFCSYVAWK